MKLNGRSYTKRDLEARVGRIEQVGGIRRFAFSEGLETDNEMIEVRTGAGLRYLVSPSRALDISLAEFGGSALTWQATSGDVHPSFYDNRGAEWLRTAVGGLLMTCGLSYVGAPGEDEGIAFGLHGRVHHIPARHVAASALWQGDEYEMTISGLVEETAVFGENLRLTRTIKSWLGDNRILVVDEVENAGFTETPLMLLYHCNFGFPLLTKDTQVTFPSQKVVARDEGVPLVGFNSWEAPDPAYTERVYYHEELAADENGRLTATIHNPQFPVLGGERPLTVHLSWQQSQLPRLVQWRMAGAGTHVLGIEPANCYVEGRAVERERGTLQMLAPGEKRSFELEFSVE